MERKLIKQGGGGYTVYLPKKWLDSKGLGSGDSVDIEVSDDKLTVRTDKTKGKETETDISGSSPHFIRMKVMNLYRLGYDRVVLGYDNGEQLKEIKNVLDELLGFSIVEREEGKVTLENISEPSLDKYGSIVRKMMFIFKEIISSIQKSEVKEINDLVEEAYRYDHFCKRAISKNIYKDENIALPWAFHVELIHAIREAYFLGKYMKDNEIDFPSSLETFIETGQEILEVLITAYSAKEEKLLAEIYEKRNFIFNEGYPALEKEDPAIVHHLMNVIRNSYLVASPLFQLISSNSLSG